MRIFLSILFVALGLFANSQKDSYTLNLGTFQNMHNVDKIVASFKNDKVNIKRLNSSVELTINNLSPFERAYEKLLKARKVVHNPFLTEVKYNLSNTSYSKPVKAINQNNYKKLGRYMIKLGSFRDRLNVDKLISSFKGQHIDVEQVGNIYRLFISNIPNLGLAQQKLIEINSVLPGAMIVTNGTQEPFKKQIIKNNSQQRASTPVVNYSQNIGDTQSPYQHEVAQQKSVQTPNVNSYKPMNNTRAVVPTINKVNFQQTVVQQSSIPIPVANNYQQEMVPVVHTLQNRVETQVNYQNEVIYQNNYPQINVQPVPMQPIIQQDIVYHSNNIPVHYPNRAIPDNFMEHNLNIDNYWNLTGLAVNNSTRVELLKHDLNILLSDYDMQMSEYYPTLALTYDHQYNRSGSLNQGTTDQNQEQDQNDEQDQNQGAQNSDFDRKHRDIANLTMNYELYRFGATDLRVNILRNRIDALINDILIEKETLSQEILTHYADALRAQTIIYYRELAKDKQNSILKTTAELKEAGVASEDELIDVKIAITTLEDEISQNRLLKQISLGEIETLLDDKMKLNRIDLAQLISKNLPNVEFDYSPLGQRSLVEIEISKNELELMRKDYLATVSTNGNYNLYDSFANDEQTNIDSNDWRLGLNVRWEFFSGFRTDNGVKRVQKQIARNFKSYDFEKNRFQVQTQKRVRTKRTRDKIIQSEAKLINRIKGKIKNLKVLKDANSVSVIDIDMAYILLLDSELNIQIQIIDQLHDDILRDLSNQNSY